MNEQFTQEEMEATNINMKKLNFTNKQYVQMQITFIHKLLFSEELYLE